ncbi:hypothetical protein A2W24_06660 [Microgenomates group bacterium RBG_16_45_19]|nr:MAG: hypothetical protein A2W24_06660 [Microgenomates group bacterium RBG_16_45_19]
MIKELGQRITEKWAGHWWQAYTGLVVGMLGLLILPGCGPSIVTVEADRLPTQAVDMVTPVPSWEIYQQMRPLNEAEWEIPSQFLSWAGIEITSQTSYRDRLRVGTRGQVEEFCGADQLPLDENEQVAGCVRFTWNATGRNNYLDVGVVSDTSGPIMSIHEIVHLILKNQLELVGTKPPRLLITAPNQCIVIPASPDANVQRFTFRGDDDSAFSQVLAETTMSQEIVAELVTWLYWSTYGGPSVVSAYDYNEVESFAWLAKQAAIDPDWAQDTVKEVTVNNSLEQFLNDVGGRLRAGGWFLEEPSDLEAGLAWVFELLGTGGLNPEWRANLPFSTRQLNLEDACKARYNPELMQTP